MGSINPDPLDLSKRPERSKGSMDSGNLASIDDSTNPPDTFSIHMNSGILTSPGPSRAGTNKSTNTPGKVYVLIYDAARWAHDETTDKVTLLDGTPISVSVSEYVSPDTVKLCGVIGTYSSERKARKIGKKWVYGQLKGLGLAIDWPLPTQDGSECTEADWRKSGWRRTADGNWGYPISDFSRSLALAVCVIESAVNDSDVEGEYRDSDDEAGKRKYILVGPDTSRKRVLATRRNEGSGGTRTEGRDSNGGGGTAVVVGQGFEIKDEFGNDKCAMIHV